MEALLGFLVELAVELLFEIGIEIGLSVLFGRLDLDRPPRPLVAATGYALLGGAIGAGSLWLVPHRLLHDPGLVAVNLVVTPFLAGAVMAGVGALRRRRGQDLIRLDSFVYGALFAGVMVGVRFAFAG